MGLRDILKKKDDLAQEGSGPVHDEKQRPHRQPPPEFTFIRTDTVSQDFIQPPDGGEDYNANMDESHLSPTRQPSKSRRSMDFFRSSRSRSESVSSAASYNSSTASGAASSPGKRRLSQRLHLKRQPESSEHVPQDLPDIVIQPNAQDREGVELQWEKRATILAEQNELARSMPNSPSLAKAEFITDGVNAMSLGEAMSRPRSRSTSSRDGSQPVSSKAIDADIQEAIRLHEAGDYQRSTKIFGQLADENGANNPLSQVLYGLALRHGWGCEPEPENAVKYLSAAASNAASVEQLALEAGLKKGGAAKGELILAIFELANCFRHGWGIHKDPIAAKQYYETAANLGDTDAMNEVAWCYLEGFGCKKDKKAAAKYYRLAETNGNKILGNTWIWKEKYDPPGEAKGK